MEMRLLITFLTQQLVSIIRRCYESKRFYKRNRVYHKITGKGRYVATCNHIYDISEKALSKYTSIFGWSSDYYIPINFSSEYPETARIFAVKWFQLQCLHDKSYLKF